MRTDRRLGRRKKKSVGVMVAMGKIERKARDRK